MTSIVDNEKEEVGTGLVAELMEESLAGRVTAQRVREEERMQFLPRYAGKRFLLVETAVFRMLAQLSTEYQGGYWHFYTLSNGGFFLAPSAPAHYRLCCDGNGFTGMVSAEAAGLIATAMALSHLSCQFEEERLIEAFYQLRDFASGHAEASSIFRALD